MWLHQSLGTFDVSKPHNSVNYMVLCQSPLPSALPSWDSDHPVYLLYLPKVFQAHSLKRTSSPRSLDIRLSDHICFPNGHTLKQALQSSLSCSCISASSDLLCFMLKDLHHFSMLDPVLTIIFCKSSGNLKLEVTGGSLWH